MVVVARAIIGFAAIGRRPELIGERGRPFLPREMPLRRQTDGERESLRLSRLRKDRPTLIAWQVCQSGEIFGLGN